MKKALILLICLGAIVLAIFWVYDSLTADACLDSGGAWIEGRCVH